MSHQLQMSDNGEHLMSYESLFKKKQPIAFQKNILLLF